MSPPPIVSTNDVVSPDRHNASTLHGATDATWVPIDLIADRLEGLSSYTQVEQSITEPDICQLLHFHQLKPNLGLWPMLAKLHFICDHCSKMWASIKHNLVRRFKLTTDELYR
jgi:hypothetical protein